MAKRPPNTSTELPSGVTVHYWDETGVDGEPQQRRYAFGPDWQRAEKLPSISTVAGVYDKPALTGWASRVTADGILQLAQAQPVENLDTEALLALLRERGLDPDSVKRKAARRGSAAHDALVGLLAEGKAPNPQDFPPEWRGYLQAGARWFLKHKPEIIDAETIVCSLEHGFAGRYDLHCRFPDGTTARVDYKTITGWSYGRQRKDGSRDLLPPYDENLYQLAGYEVAAVESGYAPSDVQLVVRLGPDGKFDVTESCARPEHFLACLDAYRNRRSLADARRAQRELVAA